MAVDRFLDTDGLRHLWEKIKSFIHQNTHEYSVEELETPTAGYRNSYRLDKDGEAIEGSDIIDIPTEFTPIVSKEYTGTDFYAPSGTWDNSSRYFMSIRPDALKEYWYVKYRVRVWIPSDTTEKRFTDSIIEYFGSGILMKGYRIWNTINTGYASCYQVAYWLTDDGYNNQNPTDPFGHVLGTSILNGSKYTTSSWYRHVKVDLLAYEGCEVNMFDNLVKWSEYKTSTGAANVATGVEHPDYNTTDPSFYNATSQGLQETGDETDVTKMYLSYARFTAGAYGMMNRSLIMQDGQGKWQSFTTSSGTSATKTKNPSGFRLGSNIYHMGSTTDYAANAISSSGLVGAFVPLIDFRYTINITTTAGGANNLVPYKPLFIVGTIGNDGLFYLDDVWWTQDEPSTENGKIYIKVCPAIYSDYTNDRCYRGDLDYNGDAYWYKDGLFQRYYGDFVTNAHLPEYTIERLTQAETSYSASYVLKKDGTQVGATINIPKDMVVSSGEVKTVTTANVPYQGAVVGDKYIDLTIANTAQNHIYIPVKDLVDVYVAGNGIQISNNNYISVKVDQNNANGLGVGGSGVSMYVVSPSINGVGGTNGSMLATDKEKLDGIEAGAEENVIETVKVSGTALQVTNKAVNIETETAYDPTTNKIATMSDVTGATPNVGHLKTDNTTAQTPSASESFTGDISLHKIAKTGSYNDLNDKPTIPSSGDFVTSLGTSGNNVTWTKNGVTNNLTVPYATKAEKDGNGNVITTRYVHYGDVLMPTNPFGGRSIYINSVDNAFAAAQRKYWVVATTHLKEINGVSYPYIDSTKAVTDPDYFVDSPVVTTLGVANIFDGNYETSIQCPVGHYMKIHIQFAPFTNDWDITTAAAFSGYPYGSYYLSYYYTSIPSTRSQLRIYSKYASSLGWSLQTATLFNLSSSGTSSLIEEFAQGGKYNRTCVEFIIFGEDSGSIKPNLTQIDYRLSRPNLSYNGSTVTKYGNQSLYYDFKWFKHNDGSLAEETVSISAPDGFITANKFIKSGGTSSQFLKADGSVDSNTYATTSQLPSLPLSIANGGTGQTTGVNAANALIGALPQWTADPSDDVYLIRRDTGGSLSFGQVKFSTVWNYIKSKIASVLGIGGSNGVPTAPTAAAGTNTTQIATTAFVQGEIENKADKVAYAIEGDLAGLDSTGNLTDSGYSISDLGNSINGQKVWFNCWTCEYGVHPYSLFSFAINPNKDGLCLTPFTTTGGTGNKRPVTTYWFPIGSNIYYHNSSEQAGQSGALKSGYTSFREVDVRYSAITGGNISLGSSINTSTYFYTTSVFLRVLISGEYWQPYHESGSTTEILVSIDQLVAGNYYIYLGKLSAETTDGLHYILQLEDNNPLYYFDGNDLIMYTKRGNIPSGGTTRQFLAKRSNSDYDVEWIGPAAAFITAYDYQNHRVTISDGTHSQEYQLTPYYPIPDYYIGWEYGTKREFASMSGSHLANNATPYMKADNTSYQSECLDTIFYVMFKPSSAPTSGSLLSGDGVNSNKLLSQITAAEFLAGGNCPHNDVTIGETTYKVYALMNVYLADGDNTITVNFN